MTYRWRRFLQWGLDEAAEVDKWTQTQRFMKTSMASVTGGGTQASPGAVSMMAEWIGSYVHAMKKKPLPKPKPKAKPEGELERYKWRDTRRLLWGLNGQEARSDTDEPDSSDSDGTGDVQRKVNSMKSRDAIDNWGRMQHKYVAYMFDEAWEYARGYKANKLAEREEEEFYNGVPKQPITEEEADAIRREVRQSLLDLQQAARPQLTQLQLPAVEEASGAESARGAEAGGDAGSKAGDPDAPPPEEAGDQVAPPQEESVDSELE